jgi:hypothetical protein
MEIKIEMTELLKDMKEYTDRFEYLMFFQRLVADTSPVLATMVNDAYVEAYGAEVPKEPKYAKDSQ